VVVDKTVDELRHHELVKVKIFAENRTSMLGVADELAAASQAELVQVIGKTAVIYRRRAKEPEVDLG